MPRIRRLLVESDLVRRSRLAAYRVCARAVVSHPGPRVLANSIPKAGTHLLTALLRRLPQMMFSGIQHTLSDFTVLSEGVDGGPVLDQERLESVLAAVRKGQFVVAHFPAHEDLMEILGKRGYRSVLMIRDPRDIAVSHAFYVSERPGHHLHRRYRHELRSDEARLLASITGLTGNGGAGLESIGRRVDQYLPWTGRSDTAVCRFESLVGPEGGGSRDDQTRVIADLARHLDRPLAPQQVDHIAARIWSGRAVTFRAGRVGDWRNHFTDEHRAAFKEVAGRQLIELGYESDMSW